MNVLFSNPEDYWAVFLDGDKLALDHIVKTHYNLLYNYGRKFSTDVNLVKDCIQELFLSLWRNRENTGQPASVKHYLLKAMRRRLQTALARLSKQQVIDISFIPIEASAGTSPESDRVQNENKTELNSKIVKAFSCLPARQQEIIYLRFCLQADAANIAQIMGLSRQSVYNLLKLALDRLREVSVTLFEQGSTLRMPGTMMVV
ncbi:RNA polymerase sigma factor [Filimonas effusa]|uniref:Sigma-70 family RNA polymerase sigma factor n=1 Tax=Filimonas effusa TaxID=2508721 RepID=A0A4Q1DBY8_9BACT|nr:sigma-70 family RNA polymerase sigma factor [Filimonas effusa]RXK86039.1 sigma-70 family RNA polymerase sigma factor [Filimonas effusa]